jgi:hypothetical protein
MASGHRQEHVRFVAESFEPKLGAYDTSVVGVQGDSSDVHYFQQKGILITLR